jgi:hypothetical protein
VPTTNTEQAARLARRAHTANTRTKAASPALEVPAYAPVAPFVPDDAAHSDQRYYTRGGTTESVRLASGKNKLLLSHGRSLSDVRASVFRNAEDDTAEVRIEINTNWNQSESRIQASASELREIAYRMLDAAHDLEVNPAAKLRAQAKVAA